MDRYRVVRIMGGDITVTDGEKSYDCISKGNLKKSSKVCVGDYVKISENNYSKGTYVIDKVLPRKNQLIRPNVTNIDQLVIVLAITPQPDLSLIDKLIIFAELNDISPILVINKVDISNETEIQNLVLQYKDVVKEIIVISAKNNIGIENLKLVLKGKFSALAGQSAVGKSTLINALDSKLNLDTNGLSEKISRGKHTTRHSEIYKIDDILIADTPGFSMLEIDKISYDDLHYYYKDFAPYFAECKFSGCTHINCTADNCEVVKNVKNGKIHLERYQRYCKMYNDMKEKWREKYD